MDDRRTSPVELLWDLVFVFAITQVTTLLSNKPSWTGFGRSMLVLALIWWAWSAFVWAANAQDPQSGVLRATLLLATLLIFISGLAIPHAFGTEATLFASTYAGVRFLHLALYADASRRGNASWSAIAGFGVTVALGMVLLIVGSLLHGGGRTTLWVIAAVIDYAGPAGLTRKRLRGLQQVAVAHFAERYALFVIICLGESIAAIGLAANRAKLDSALVVIVGLGLAITVGLWWIYFDRFATRAEERLRTLPDPVLAASDAYSYLHLLLVAGIIVFAAGMRLAIESGGRPLGDAARLALCGGTAFFLLGHAAFRLRLVRELGWAKLLAAGGTMIAFALTGSLRAWAVAALIAGIVAALCAVEVLSER